MARYRRELAPGDTFALWLSGRAAGVYALGILSSPALPVETLGPTAQRFVVEVQVDTWLVDGPVPRPVLAADPRFAMASILRQPFAANPFRLSAEEWQAVCERVDVSDETCARREREPRPTG